MKWASVIIALALLSATSSLPQDASVPPATIQKCQEAVSAQDEVIGSLDKQVAELKAALEARRAEAETLRAANEAMQRTVDSYKALWLQEAEAAAAERKRMVWSERFAALRWGLLGFSTGVVAETWAKP